MSKIQKIYVIYDNIKIKNHDMGGVGGGGGGVGGSLFGGKGLTHWMYGLRIYKTGAMG